MYGRNVQIRIGGPLTPMVKRLLIILGSIFILQLIAKLFYGNSVEPGFIEKFFGLSHKGLIYEFKIWQLFTYMFLHGGFIHILFNGIAIWMFGGELEEYWGSKRFLKYFLYSGIGAGFFIAALNAFTATSFNAAIPTVGISGAVFALLLAYGLTWPNREVLLYFVIPIKIKYLVIIFGLIEFFGTLQSASGTGSGISHIGHLGGLISGYLLLTYGMNRFMSEKKASSTKKKSEGLFSGALKKKRLAKKQKEIEKRIEAKRVIDEMLAKIARTGMSSLTPEEKEKLEWARRNYYPDKSDTLH